LHEAFGLIEAFDDLGLEIGQDFGVPVRKNRALTLTRVHAEGPRAPRPGDHPELRDAEGR
jgi:hypothetical protein